MKLFFCQHCGQLLYFDNVRCEKCGHRLGYLPSAMTLSALEPQGDAWHALADPSTQVRFCRNAEADGCNWLVEADSDLPFCAACRFNRTIPDLSDPVNMVRWRKIEAAKRYLFYALLRLHVPVRDRTQDPEHGLAFDFLADPPTPTPEEIPDGTPGASNEAPDGVPKVMTGHDNGLITIALIEADDAERERRRTELHEPYRSLLGHFRHEVGHYAWDLLIRDGGRLDACRTVFGDDSQDYGEALQRHYRNGAPPDWQDHFVSAYASSHPWEDWAETWAHYLHIVDTLEMAYAFGLRVRPRGVRDDSLKAAVDFDPYANVPMETIIDAWLPLTFAMNSLNRSMGQSDLYPFVLSPEVITKLAFVHRTVHEAAPATSVPSQPPVSASRPRARR